MLKTHVYVDDATKVDILNAIKVAKDCILNITEKEIKECKCDYDEAGVVTILSAGLAAAMDMIATPELALEIMNSALLIYMKKKLMLKENENKKMTVHEMLDFENFIGEKEPISEKYW